MSLHIVPSEREQWISGLIKSETVSTPALIIDSSEIDQVLGLFKHFLPEALLFYAVKSNHSPVLVRYLLESGLSFDVSSGEEIGALRGLAVPPGRMMLTNPVKSPATLNAFTYHGLRFATVDNEYDLGELIRYCQNAGRIGDVSIFVRVKIASTDVQIDLNQKFGCTEKEAVQLLITARTAGLKVRGVQFHVGTQSWNTYNYTTGVEAALRVFDQLKDEYGILCDTVNIGGGFPDPHVAREAGGFERFFKSLKEATRPIVERGLNLLAEPGRIISSGACSAVCTIIGKSIRNGIPWIYLDDGTYGLFSGKFFDHKEFQFRVITQKSVTQGRKFVPYVVAGPTCDSIDIICEKLLLPPGLEPGDVLCAHNMGAYSIVTASNFNGFGKINCYFGSSSRSKAREDTLVAPTDRWAIAGK